MKAGWPDERFFIGRAGLRDDRAFLLAAGGVKLALNRQTRARGVLMLVAAVVIIMNVMIWTV
jgi:hypothetical protein